MQFQNISILPSSPEGLKFVLHPPPLPPGNSSLFHTLLLKMWPLTPPPPPPPDFPLGISNDLPWGGYGFFSETTQFTIKFHYYFLISFLGFVQFIDSTPVAEVLDKDADGSIQVVAAGMRQLRILAKKTQLDGCLYLYLTRCLLAVKPVLILFY